MTITKLLLFTAFIGDLICWRCDWIITYTPSGRFKIDDLQDNNRLSETFRTAPLKRPLGSMLFGVLALAMIFCGYLGLYEWMKQYSMMYAAIIMAAAIVFIVPGTAHHIFCGVVEWLYIRLGRTEEARKVILELFKKTSVTMAACYVGLLVFSVSFFIAVVSGITPLPRWVCVFNILPIFIVLSPFRIAGTGNIAGAVMFAGLFFFI